MFLVTMSYWKLLAAVHSEWNVISLRKLCFRKNGFILSANETHSRIKNGYIRLDWRGVELPGENWTWVDQVLSRRSQKRWIVQRLQVGWIYLMSWTLTSGSMMWCLHKKYCGAQMLEIRNQVIARSNYPTMIQDCIKGYNFID